MLTFTVYMLLQGLTNKLQVGDLDSCLDIMIEVSFRKRELHCFVLFLIRQKTQKISSQIKK